MKKLIAAFLVAASLTYIQAMELDSTTSTEVSPFEAIIDPRIMRIISYTNFSWIILKTAQSFDGTKIVILDINGIVSLWDAPTGRCLDKHMALDKKEALALGFNKEGTKVILLFSEHAEEYSVIHPAVLATIHKESRYALTILKRSHSTNREKIVIFDSKGIVSLWNAKTGQCLNQCLLNNKQDVLSIEFNAQGTKIIIVTPKTIEEIAIELRA